MATETQFMPYKPEEELVKLKSSQKQPIQSREKGQGRPTKKERRMMDKMRGKY